MVQYFSSLDPITLLKSFPGSIAQGMVWCVLALGVYITFRILDFADLTVDGSIAFGGAVCVMLIRAGISPIVATIVSFFAGNIGFDSYADFTLFDQPAYYGTVQYARFR